MAKSYYMLDVAALPDELHTPDTPPEKWKERCVVAEGGFPENALHEVHPVSNWVHAERMVGIPFYLLLNVLPFALPIALALPKSYLLLPILYYQTVLLVLAIPFMFFYRHSTGGLLASKKGGPRVGQYLYTERNTTKYISLKVVWPQSLHNNPADKPLLILAVPHGFAPLGVTGYSVWSKLFGPLCRWTTAPVVLKLPVVGGFMRSVGYIAADKKAIEDTLVHRRESVGVILDGIAGMFHPGSSSEEVAFLRERKGIIKIALRAGATVVPAYGFGHTSLWTILADPFGGLRALSMKLDTSLVLGLGRFCWPLGPPSRVPVTVALGEPIECPTIPNPTMEQVDEWHARMLQGYTDVFETHKAACGAAHKTLRFV